MRCRPRGFSSPWTVRLFISYVGNATLQGSGKEESEAAGLGNEL